MNIIKFPEDIVKFFEPHSGFSGALIPLPDGVKNLANYLDGRRLSLADAVSQFTMATDGVIRARDGLITLELQREILTHHWGLIRYRK